MGRIVLIGLFIVLAAIGGIKEWQERKEREAEGEILIEEEDKGEILTSKLLHEEWTDERKSKGDSEIPAINNSMGANTGNLARKDKSWKSAPDFFAKMFKKER